MKDALKKVLTAKVAAHTTDELKKMAKELMSNFEDGAGIVFNEVLNVLEGRMTETEYTQFCETL